MMSCDAVTRENEFSGWSFVVEWRFESWTEDSIWTQITRLHQRKDSIIFLIKKNNKYRIGFEWERRVLQQGLCVHIVLVRVKKQKKNWTNFENLTEFDIIAHKKKRQVPLTCALSVVVNAVYTGQSCSCTVTVTVGDNCPTNDESKSEAYADLRLWVCYYV